MTMKPDSHFFSYDFMCAFVRVSECFVWIRVRLLNEMKCKHIVVVEIVHLAMSSRRICFQSFFGAYEMLSTITRPTKKINWNKKYGKKSFIRTRTPARCSQCVIMIMHAMHRHKIRTHSGVPRLMEPFSCPVHASLFFSFLRSRFHQSARTSNLNKI